MSRFPGCQLASEYKAWPKGALEMLVEPKLDGYRLSAVILDGQVTFHCRNAEPPDWAVNLGHIAEELLEVGFPDGVMVDGEVMADDWNSTGIIRRKKLDDETKQKIRDTVRFYAFDLVILSRLEQRKIGRSVKTVDPTQKSQRRTLLELFLNERGGRAVRINTGRLVYSHEELMEVFQQLVDAGHEGAMVKDWDAPYVMDRSENWLKLKPVQTFEARIDHLVEGNGKHAGMMGAIHVVTKDGTKLAVGTGFTDEVRADLWRQRDELPGRIIEIKSQDSAACAATVRHPVFVRFRPDRTDL